MKIIFALMLCLFASTAFAGIFATGSNSAGGQIVLTDLDCPDQENTKIVYSTAPGGKITITGCWTYSDGQVYVTWSDGDFYTYPATNFTLGRKYNDQTNQQDEPYDYSKGA